VRRVVLVAALFLALGAVGVRAQSGPPATTLDPSAVDPNLVQAIATDAAQLGYDYAGDCQVAPAADGQLCSEVFQTRDSSLYVTLIDSVATTQGVLRALQAEDGSWSLVPANDSGSAASQPVPPDPNNASPAPQAPNRPTPPDPDAPRPPDPTPPPPQMPPVLPPDSGS
jgi:hypothetical protein